MIAFNEVATQRKKTGGSRTNPFEFLLMSLFLTLRRYLFSPFSDET